MKIRTEVECVSWFDPARDQHAFKIRWVKVDERGRILEKRGVIIAASEESLRHMELVPEACEYPEVCLDSLLVGQKIEEDG